MKRVLRIAVIAASMISVAEAAGPFDGNWTGETPAIEGCGIWKFHLTIASGTVTGYVDGQSHGRRATGVVQNGDVAPNGAAQIVWTLNDRLAGKFRFAGNAMTGQFTGPCGEASVTGRRTR